MYPHTCGYITSTRDGWSQTQLIVFKKKGRLRSKPIKLKLFDEELIESKNAKLLGVTLNCFMSFNDHIEDCRKKANRRLNLLKLLSGTDWGCNPKTLMRLYKCYIRPVLEYGSIVMLSASKGALKKLQVIQNKAIKIAYRLHPHSHTDEIHEIAGIEPIKVRFQQLANKFIHSLETNSKLFQDQKILHASKIKSGKTTLLDTLMKDYEQNWLN